MRKLRHPWRPGGALVLVLVVLAIAGCGPATTPTTQPAAPAAPPPASAPSAAAAPPAAQSDWQRDWEQTLAAARREGKVVVNGSASATYRGPLTAFNQDYPDIQLDFSSMPAPQFWERVQRERAAEQYLWDVNVYGVELQMFQARDSGLLDPVRPLLVLPEVAGDANWLGGVDNLFFYEKQHQYFASFFASVQTSTHVNRDLLSETDLPSMKELTEPRFKGKLAMYDPREGAGLAELTVLLAAYGEEFVTSLLTRQDLVLTTDRRQLAEWVVRGRYPVGIGLALSVIGEFHKEGVGLNVKTLPGPQSLSSAGGTAFLMNRAPHPNAAKVYINWLLSQKTQSALAAATGFNSLRTDVPPVDSQGVVDPAHMDQYVVHQAEQVLPVRQRAQELAQRFLGSR